MKTAIAFWLLSILFAFTALGADVPEASLPTAGGMNGSDFFRVVTNGHSAKATPTMVGNLLGTGSFVTTNDSRTFTLSGASIGGNASTATTATNLAGPIASLSIGTLTVTNPPVLDGSQITNLSSGSFRFSVPTVTDSATNWIVDLGPGKGVYKTITATNNICFLYCTNGPGVASIKIYPNGADRLISVPTNWMAYSTNSWALNGTFWSRTLTNAAGTVGPRVMTLSVRNETASTQTNTDWGFLVTVP